MKKSYIAMTIALMCAVFSCSKSDNDGPVEIELATKGQEFADATLDITAKLFESVEDEGNVAFSPFSVQMAMSMIAEGTDGQTRDEILDAMGISSGEIQELRSYSCELMKKLPRIGKGLVDLKIVNGVFLDGQYNFEKDFVNVLKGEYLAEAKTFSSLADLERQAKDWVEKSTDGSIKDFNVNPNNVSIITTVLNAMTFKGKWKNPFKKNLTSPTMFTSRDGSRERISIMKQQKWLTACNNRRVGFKCVYLPYKGDNYRMEVYLPDSQDKMKDMLQYLKDNNYNLTEEIDSYNVDLWLPKFETESYLELDGVLKSMGIKKAFAPDADFSNLTKDINNVYLVSSLQKTILSVDEEGTVAKTVTSVSAGGRVAIVHELEFHADHPYIYLIREISTGVCLFAGQFVEKQ